MPVDPEILLLLLLAAFGAGMVDAIVGGGGLVQLPALLLALPTAPIASVLGTNKLVSICGTSTAAYNFTRRYPPRRDFAAPMVVAGFFGSLLGASAVRLLPTEAVKPVVLILLACVWVYTALRRDFGEIDRPHPARRKAMAIAIAGGGGIGFYDGLVGPGTGSFLIFLLIGAVGMNFVKASATAKLVNVATNLAAVILFSLTTHLLWTLAAAMAACNIAGGFIGSHLTMKKGTRFVRIVFLVVVAALIIRLSFDVF